MSDTPSEVVPNKNNNDEQNSKTENDAPKVSTRKKFSNTLFAAKMRNRKREEKLKQLDAKDALNTCKLVSVDVTRLSSEVVPKIISTVKNTHCKNKRFQWKLSKRNKRRKKIRKEELKVDNVEKESASEKVIVNVKGNEENLSSSDKKQIVNDEKVEKHKVKNKEPSLEKNDKEKRRSLRFIMPSTSFEEKSNNEKKVVTTPVLEERYSCSRTEPFIGKLNTKEARVQNIEKILKEESESVEKLNFNVNDATKDLCKTDEQSKVNPPTEETSKTKSDSSNIKTNENISKVAKCTDSKNNSESDKQIISENKGKSKRNNNSASSSQSVTEKIPSQDSKKSSNNVMETKEYVKEDEIYCRRTVPFLGKTTRKSQKNLLIEPIEIPNCHSDTSLDVDSQLQDINTKPGSSIKSVNKPSEVPKSTSTDVNSSKLIIPLKDNTVESTAPSKNANVKLDTINNLNSEISMNCTKLKENTPTKTHVHSKLDTLTRNIDIDLKSSLNCENMKNVTSNSDNDMKDSKNVSCNANNFWSCRRTEPYSRKEYLNCSRTLPFVCSSKNSKPETSETNTYLLHNENSLQEDISHNVSIDSLTSSEKKETDDSKISIPEIQVKELINETNKDTATDITTISKENAPAPNGEWKFKRKHQKSTETEVEAAEENQIIKKMKLKSIKPSKILETSPGKTICSLFSLNCTKHQHDHECDDSVKNKQAPCVLITKLEKSRDPVVVEYLKTIEVNSKTETNTVTPLKFKFDNDEENPDLIDKKQIVPDSEGEKNETKDLLKRNASTDIAKAIPNMEPKMETVTLEENEKAASEFRSSESSETIPRKRRTRTSSGFSSSSSNTTRLKRKKGPVNYLENFSDSDTNESSTSFSMSLRTRSQSRGPVLRNRKKLRNYTQEDDENDTEVDEFSQLGLKNRLRSATTDNFNLDNSNNNDGDVSTSKITSSSQNEANQSQDNVQIRSKSVLEKKIQEKHNLLQRSKTPSTCLAKEQSENIKQMLNEVNQQRELDDMSTDQEVEELTLDRIRSRLRNRSSIGGSLQKAANEKPLEVNIGTDTENQQLSVNCSKTPTRNLEESQSPCTPKAVTNENAIASIEISKDSSEKSKASKTISPRKTAEKSPRTEKGSPQMNDTSNPSSEAAQNAKENLLAKFDDANPEITFSINALAMKDLTKNELKVQLVKLETICRNYQDYSASEFEVISDKYIDLLMNANITCDTWKPLINYHRPTDITEKNKNLEEVDNNDCVTDSEIQGSAEETLVAEEIQNDNDISITESRSTMESPKKSEQNQLIDNVAVIPSTSTNKETETIADALQSNTEVIDTLNSFSVNGTAMFSCAACNKIFVDDAFLNEHIETEHRSKKKSRTTKKEKCKGKVKKRLQSKSNSLMCSICKVLCDSKDLLFVHILTHNEHELQAAYNVAMANLGNCTSDTDTGGEDLNKSQKSKSNDKSSTDDHDASDRALITSITNAASEQPQVIGEPVTDTMATIERAPANTTLIKPIGICPCHAHETSVQDLQIEVILLCKVCRVVFRRRDCFEVHFRTSTECRRSRTNKEVSKMPKLFCSGCLCLLGSLIDMRAHLEMHAQKNRQGTVTFVCNICKVAFFGVGGIFYSHWFNHTKAPDFVASRYSFPKLSVVSVLEDSNVPMTSSKSQEGFFYIAEHVCRKCRLPFSSEPELQKHKSENCSALQTSTHRIEAPEHHRLQMTKLICDLCKKYYMNKEQFDRHCLERNHLKTPITKFSRVAINNDESALVCTLCRFVCKSLDDMKEHFKVTHSPIMELYTCKTCNVVPSNDVANYTFERFKTHCQEAHKSEVITCLVYFVTAPHVCDSCRCGFDSENTLKDHKVVHENRRVPSHLLPSAATTTSTAPITSSVLTTPLLSQALTTPQVQGPPRLVAPRPSSSTTYWVANQNVYTQYSNANGHVTTQNSIVNNAMLPQMNNLDGPTNVSMAGSPILQPSVANKNAATNTVLRNMLNQRFLQAHQQSQNVTSASPETILIDSRSNSPTLTASSDSTPSTSDKIAPNKASATNRKSYMTMVNPDFESILGSHNGQAGESSSASLQSDKENSDNRMSPGSLDSLTPQPFEVVLVTDDLSEHSNHEETATKETTGATERNDSTSKDQETADKKDNMATKSFLRVRSVAELQRIKIHLCSVCGLSFDNLQAFELHSQQHKSASPQIFNEIGRSTPVQMISPMITQNNKNAQNDSLQSRPKMALLSPNSQQSLNSDLNTRNSRPQQLQQKQHQPSWVANSNGSKNCASPNVNYGYDVNRQQHLPNLIRKPSSNIVNEVGGNSSSTRGPPPPYPGSSNSLTPGRPGAIQLPERNNAGNNTPTTKRPSGAATRIPQQSLPSFEELNEHRQNNIQMSYNHTLELNESSPNSRLLPNTNVMPSSQLSSQLPSSLQLKTYSRRPIEVHYANPNGNQNYIPQQRTQKEIYSCKIPNCSFRSENLITVTNHEKQHFMTQQQSSSESSNQSFGIIQQQRQTVVKHVAVSQMPERTRHAVPNSRISFSCRDCNLNFNSKKDLMQHTALAHSIPSAGLQNQVCCYVCDYCEPPLLFKNEDLLRKHMDLSHNFICRICSKRYPSSDGLKIHFEEHSLRT